MEARGCSIAPHLSCSCEWSLPPGWCQVPWVRATASVLWRTIFREQNGSEPSAAGTQSSWGKQRTKGDQAGDHSPCSLLWVPEMSQLSEYLTLAVKRGKWGGRERPECILVLGLLEQSSTNCRFCLNNSNLLSHRLETRSLKRRGRQDRAASKGWRGASRLLLPTVWRRPQQHLALLGSWTNHSCLCLGHCGTFSLSCL